MKTVIDNNQRVFQVVDSFGRSIFCNLGQLNEAIKFTDSSRDYFTIYHFWNSKPKKCSYKFLKEMFESNNMTLELF